MIYVLISVLVFGLVHPVSKILLNQGWLKKNTRIEALMFVEYLAQMTTALTERQLRQQMQVNNIKLLTSLPEGRASPTPTFKQLLRLFEGSQRHELFDKQRIVESYSAELTPVQSQILSLIGRA